MNAQPIPPSQAQVDLLNKLLLSSAIPVARADEVLAALNRGQYTITSIGEVIDEMQDLIGTRNQQRAAAKDRQQAWKQQTAPYRPEEDRWLDG